MNGHGKRAISVRATEGLLYILSVYDLSTDVLLTACGVGSSGFTCFSLFSHMYRCTGDLVTFCCHDWNCGRQIKYSGIWQKI